MALVVTWQDEEWGRREPIRGAIVCLSYGRAAVSVVRPDPSVPPWSRAGIDHYTPGWTGSQPKALKRGSLRYSGLGGLPRVCGMILRRARRDFEQGTQEQ